MFIFGVNRKFDQMKCLRCQTKHWDRVSTSDGGMGTECNGQGAQEHSKVFVIARLILLLYS